MQIISLPVKGLYAAFDRIVSDIPVQRLHSREQHHLKKIRHNKRRAEIITSRIVLKDLAGMAGLDRASFHIEKDNEGRPMGVNGHTTIPVGISHSNRHVLCALYFGGTVGLDIESTNRRMPAHLPDRILAPSEFDLLDNFPLVRLWTIKEAVLKQQGLGLYAGMPNVVIRPMDSHYFQAEFRDRRFRVFSLSNDSAWIAVSLFDGESDP